VAAIAAGAPAAAGVAMRDHISSVIESLESLDALPPRQAGRTRAGGRPAATARPADSWR
jgi:hypothetical protein